MYQTACILPPLTNREDYLLTLAVNDDDTLEPVDLSGITLAAGTDFTGNSWTVTAGGILTASVTPFTIPAFPVTGDNNLTALAIAVAPHLAIRPGVPVTIADAGGSASAITGYVLSYSANTGVLTVQIGWTFQFEIRRGGPRNAGAGYIPWWDWGTPDDLGPLLQANFGNGCLSLVEANKLQIFIPEATVKTLGSTGLFAPSEGDAPGTYHAALTGTDSVNTRQFLVASQPILYGGVTI